MNPEPSREDESKVEGFSVEEIERIAKRIPAKKSKHEIYLFCRRAHQERKDYKKGEKQLKKFLNAKK